MRSLREVSKATPPPETGTGSLANFMAMCVLESIVCVHHIGGVLKIKDQFVHVTATDFSTDK